MTKKAFKKAEALFHVHGEPVTNIPGCGSAAFTSTIGTGAYTDNTIVALKGSNQILITAIEQLATSILPTV